MSWEVIEGDCLEVMRGMADASVDAVITDPPYGIGFDYDGKREDTNTPETYWTWLRPRYEEMLRIVRPGGFVAVWQAQLNFRHFWHWFGDDIHIYCAAKNFVQLRKTPINYGYDPVVMRYDKRGPALRPLAPKRSIDFFVANTATVISQAKARQWWHPCPRPLDQMQIVAENFALPGGTVLDPFCGSGTTGVACINTGRHFIGIEKEPQYVAIARRRLTDAAAQPRLEIPA
jgi:DNA modification methylase